MRLSNERDQQIVRSAVSDAAESLLRFLPSLGTRETIVFGEGVTLPTRIMLAELDVSVLPMGASAHLDATYCEEPDPAFVDEAIMRWRSVGSDIESLLPPEPEAAPEVQAIPAAPGTLAASRAASGNVHKSAMAQPAQVSQPAQAAQPAPTVALATAQPQPAPAAAMAAARLQTAPAAAMAAARLQTAQAAPAAPQTDNVAQPAPHPLPVLDGGTPNTPAAPASPQPPATLQTPPRQ